MIAIDLFCGAGGFSEGILQAGFHIVFSSDRSIHVMETYKSRHEQLGLKQGINTHFELADIQKLEGEEILRKVNALEIFKGNPISEIDVVFGGPPCQGFSKAGRRNKKDPRNMLFREYTRIISEIRPKYVVMENVDGFMSMELNPDFVGVSGDKYPDKSLACKVLPSELEKLGYTVLEPQLLNSSNYGVPQARVRVIFLAYRNDVEKPNYPEPTTPLKEQKVTVMDAIGDLILDKTVKRKVKLNTSDYLESLKGGRTPSFTTGNPISNYKKIYNHETSKHKISAKERFSLYRQGESTKNLETRIKREGLNLEAFPDLMIECWFSANKDWNLSILTELLEKQNLKYSTLVEEDKKKMLTSIFNKIVSLWNKGISLNVKLKSWLTSQGLGIDEFNNIFETCKIEFNKKVSKDQLIKKFKAGDIDVDFIEYLLTKKNSRVRLNSQGVAPTMLTLPDDFISPFENRILTVREMARIQGFDDSFEFLGKRTTGGSKRKDEVPQYTQVGNAVPPPMAYAIAMEIKKAIEKTIEKNSAEITVGIK